MDADDCDVKDDEEERTDTPAQIHTLTKQGVSYIIVDFEALWAVRHCCLNKLGVRTFCTEKRVQAASKDLVKTLKTPILLTQDPPGACMVLSDSLFLTALFTIYHTKTFILSVDATSTGYTFISLAPINFDVSMSKFFEDDDDTDHQSAEHWWCIACYKGKDHRADLKNLSKVLP